MLNKLKIRKNITKVEKIVASKEDDYTIAFFLDYVYFRDNYKKNAIDLGKQQASNADQTAIQQINFTENLDCANNTIIFFILEEAKETVLNFSQGTAKKL